MPDNLNSALDFTPQIEGIERSLKGERRKRNQEGKEEVFYETKLPPEVINEIMVNVKSVLSINTVMSFYNADYVRQTTFSIWYAVYTLLDSEVRLRHITIDDRDLIAESIKHAVHSALLRGLAGIDREKYYRSLQTNITVQGGGSGSFQPTRVQ